MATSPTRLGELLEARGQITREQLLRALRNQKVLGGRLGTCLLEIDALSEEQLCSALAELHGVPSASPEDLRGIPDDVLALLPPKVARRCRAIAFQASSTQVKVALMDARNLGFQDEVSFVIGKRIRWHVAPELRIVEALEKNYGEECPTRLAKLLDRMNRSRFLWARESAAIAAQNAAPGGNKEQLLWDRGIAGVAAEDGDGRESLSGELPQFQHQELALPASVAMPAADPGTPAKAPAAPGAKPAAPGAAPPSAPAASPKPAASPTAPVSPKTAKAPMPPPVAAQAPAERAEREVVPPEAPAPAVAAHRKVTVDEAEHRLLRPRERDDVARALIDFAAGLAQRAVLFVVRKGEIAAWLWAGEEIDEPKLTALQLRLDQPSVFAGFKQGGRIFQGELAPLPSHEAIAACFTRRVLAGTVLVLPVRVRDRLVAALYLEPSIASPAVLAAGDLAALERVVAKAEIAFELCIMQAKLRKA